MKISGFVYTIYNVDQFSLLMCAANLDFRLLALFW